MQFEFVELEDADTEMKKITCVTRVLENVQTFPRCFPHDRERARRGSSGLT